MFLPMINVQYGLIYSNLAPEKRSVRYLTSVYGARFFVDQRQISGRNMKYWYRV
jgi:hypothetical protein